MLLRQQRCLKTVIPSLPTTQERNTRLGLVLDRQQELIGWSIQGVISCIDQTTLSDSSRLFVLANTAFEDRIPSLPTTQERNTRLGLVLDRQQELIGWSTQGVIRHQLHRLDDSFRFEPTFRSFEATTVRIPYLKTVYHPFPHSWKGIQGLVWYWIGSRN